MIYTISAQYYKIYTIICGEKCRRSFQEPAVDGAIFCLVGQAERFAASGLDFPSLSGAGCEFADKTSLVELVGEHAIWGIGPGGAEFLVMDVGEQIGFAGAVAVLPALAVSDEDRGTEGDRRDDERDGEGTEAGPAGTGGFDLDPFVKGF